MKVLLIDNYDSFTYNIVELLRQLSLKDFTIIKNDEVSIEIANRFDKIIISPGPATPSESGNIIPIIKTLAPTHGILGICLGHQAIAEAFGASLKNVSSPYHGYQTELNIINPHKLFSMIPSNKTIKVGLYHSWIIDENTLPDCLQISSYSSENVIMSIQHKVFDVHGIQFHPESYMTEYGKEMLQCYLS